MLCLPSFSSSCYWKGRWLFLHFLFFFLFFFFPLLFASLWALLLIILFGNRCVICQMRYKRGDRQIKLPCKHVYHSECISKWLGINKVCLTLNFATFHRCYSFSLNLFTSLLGFTLILVSFWKKLFRYAQFATLRYLARNRGTKASIVKID